jgi:hypothetical protein
VWSQGPGEDERQDCQGQVKSGKVLVKCCILGKCCILRRSQIWKKIGKNFGKNFGKKFGTCESDLIFWKMTGCSLG